MYLDVKIRKDKEMINAVIPVRAGSKRMKNKNIAPFNRSTLLDLKIETLKKVPGIDMITVTSDSDVMLEIAKSHGVNIHKRPDEYCDEVTRTYGEMIKYVCSEIKGDDILWTLCTNPLVSSSMYSKGIKEYYESQKQGYDSMLACVPEKEFFWDNKGPINYELGTLQVRSQDLPNWFRATGAMNMAPKNKMIEWSYHVGKKPYMFILDKFSGVDIDDELDFIQAEAWAKAKPELLV